MKKFTFLWCLLLCLTTAMNGQNLQTKSSINDLLTRYSQVGNQTGSVSDYFSKEEQQMLRTYFKSHPNATRASRSVAPNDLIVPSSARNAALANRTVALPAAYANASSFAIGEGTPNTRNYNPNISIPFTGTYSANRTASIVYDNGSYFSVSGSPDVSLLEDTTLGMNSFGAGAQFTAGNSMSDDVVLTADYDITSIDVFAYQSFSTAPSITAVYLQVWDGDPSAGGSSVIWGDLTTNILDNATATNAFRQLESAPGNMDREIQRVTATTAGLSLLAGTYWIEYTFEGSGASGPWAPPVAILGQSTTGNALQNQSGTWVPLVDVGSQGLPFVMYGDSAGGGASAYCIPEGTNSARFVNNFSTTGGDENISNMGSGFSTGGYGDFYDTDTVAQDQDGTVDFSVDIEGGIAGFRAWVDWNQDGVFDTTEEVAYSSSSYENSHTGTITVPTDALEGDTRMRIVSHWLSTTGDVDPCETGFTYGEFEDYKFTVTSGGGGGPGPLTTVYGINNFNQDLIGFGTATPSDVEVFGTSPITVNFENAGAIDPANPTTGYVLDNGGQFYSFDVTTGLYTSLGTISGDWVGMEYDRASGILYGIAGTDLYTIDPVGLSATLVGSLGLDIGALPVAIAIDGAGVGYMYDIVDDNLYSIDLATGAATVIGNIGFDANFGQGMAYDPTTDMVYMAAFNSTAFLAEWRSVDTATGTTTLIGNLVDPDAQVGWASVGETLPPPACPKPTNLTVTNITETTADLNWDAEPNAGNGYVWYVFEEGADPITATPVATGTTPSGTTTATATGLTNGMSYDFYVVADCDTDGLSNLAGPITFTTEITPPACGGKFYDNGGPTGDYANSSNDTTTINPDVTGDVVTVTFTSFNVEATWDALYVYDGPDATFPLIDSGNPATNSGFPAGGYYGTDIIGPFTSTDASGALTFVFMSDGSVPKAGWEADVTCTTPPPPNDMIANSIDVDEVGFPYTDPNVQMPFATTEDGNPNGCDLTGANGVWYNFVPTGDGTAVATIVSPSGASSVTFYTAPNESAVETDLTLVAQNSNQCGPGTTTTINTVAGQAYYVFVLNTDSATDITIDGTNLGVSDNTIAGFTFYPNPSTDILNLRSVDNIESVSIYNMLGQQVISNKVNATSSQLNVSSLSTGTYLMKVTVNGQTGTYRVLKN